MADNRKIAIDFLRGKGLTPAQSAGVVGSLMQESGLRTDAKNPSSGALGIAQWLGGRQTNLLRQGDLGIRGQLNFLWQELQGPERAALDRLKGAHTVPDAAAAFTWGFERPGRAEANMANRIHQGRAALGLVSDGGGGGGSSGSEVTDGGTRTTTTTTPGVDNSQARAQLVMSYLNTHRTDPVEFAVQARALQDIAPTKTSKTVNLPGTTTAAPKGSTRDGTSSGRFNISGPSPGRLKPQLVSFAEKVAGVYGGPLVGLDGSTHDKMTTNGTVSQHYTGNATDIFTIGGKSKGDPGWQQTLIDAGRAALIAAGMPRAKAMKAGIGLYNVGSHQIIFGTNSKALGGDHTDHLHISAR